MLDLKKIIALSTLSQLGIIIVILCLAGCDLADFHMLCSELYCLYVLEELLLFFLCTVDSYMYKY